MELRFLVVEAFVVVSEVSVVRSCSQEMAIDMRAQPLCYGGALTGALWLVLPKLETVRYAFQLVAG